MSCVCILSSSVSNKIKEKKIVSVRVCGSAACNICFLLLPEGITVSVSHVLVIVNNLLSVGYQLRKCVFGLVHH